MSRYIDADKILYKDLSEGRGGCWVTFMDWIKEIPTADVRENVRGEWIWNPDGMDWGIGAWVCSECGNKPQTWWGNDKSIAPLRCSGSSYCPNCGAYMRGDS